MENPVDEVQEIVLRLTTGSPRVQEDTLKQYFTPNASFTHPFCSVRGNRDVVLRIFQWYRIMSPHIDITINSVAFDESKLMLYVNISQVFRIWVIPLYQAPVTLTTVLELERGHNLNNPIAEARPLRRTEKFYIQSQNDLYQVDQFIRFVLPWGIGALLVLVWHWFATLFCILGAIVGYPLRSYQQSVSDQRPGHHGMVSHSMDHARHDIKPRPNGHS